MIQSNALSGIVLYVRSPGTLAQFYIDHLGMSMSHHDDEIRLSYKEAGGYIAFRQASSGQSYKHDLNDRYWKIGITLPNIDLAYEQLRQKGIDVTQPSQFQDIGYLCKVTDPEGFQIELLQHTFEDITRTAEGDKSLPLGGGGILGHITLRTNDIKADLEVYEKRLGMKLLSVQPVPTYNFDLYFLAYTDETPPNPDLESVENRQWLWQRPYTVLEIQHRKVDGVVIQSPAEDSLGFAAVRTVFSD